MKQCSACNEHQIHRVFEMCPACASEDETKCSCGGDLTVVKDNVGFQAPDPTSEDTYLVCENGCSN